MCQQKEREWTPGFPPPPSICFLNWVLLLYFIYKGSARLQLGNYCEEYWWQGQGFAKIKSPDPESCQPHSPILCISQRTRYQQLSGIHSRKLPFTKSTNRNGPIFLTAHGHPVTASYVGRLSLRWMDIVPTDYTTDFIAQSFKLL